MSDPEKSSSAWAVYDSAGKMLRVVKEPPVLAAGEKCLPATLPKSNYLPPDAKIAALTQRVVALEDQMTLLLKRVPIQPPALDKL